MLALIAALSLSPFYANVAPEVRSTYVSLGKIVEDRPMQVTSLRFGLDTAKAWDELDLGRFGVRGFSVSSLTDRRHDVHRHCLYHYEFGPCWDYDVRFSEDWKLKTSLTRSWTLYRGFFKEASNATYHWWEFGTSLENPYVVPFSRVRRCFRGSDYLWFRLGLRRRFALWHDLYLTPSIAVDGGNARNFNRVIGKFPDGGWGHGGVSSITFGLELGWKFCANASVFAFVEQYEIVGGTARDMNEASDYVAAHNDWTLGGVGVRMNF